MWHAAQQQMGYNQSNHYLPLNVQQYNKDAIKVITNGKVTQTLQYDLSSFH